MNKIVLEASLRYIATRYFAFIVSSLPLTDVVNLLYTAKGRKKMEKSLQLGPVVKTALSVLSAIVILLGVLGGDLRAAKPEDTTSVPPAKKLHYLCDDGRSFTLEIDNKEDCVILSLDGKPIKLPRVISASGARYSNGKTTVWLKGDEAFIEIDGKITIKNCRIKE